MKTQVLYALTATADFEILDNYNGREGTFIKGFLMNDKRNKNGWRVTWDAIKKYSSDFINHPGTYLEIEGEPDHPDGDSYIQNMSNQELARVTNIIEVQLDEEKKQLNYVAEILPPELSELRFEDMLNDGLIDYTSPGIWPEEFENVGFTEDGRPALDVFKFRALHYSYINDPAFGKDTAFTIGTCEGDGIACSRQLAAKLIGKEICSKQLEIGIKIEMEHTDDPEIAKKIAMDHLKEDPEYYQKLIKNVEPENKNLLDANDNLAPLQEVPLIRNKLNRTMTPCDIDKTCQNLNSSTDDSPLAKALRTLMKEKPDMPQDKQLATAMAFSQQATLTKLVSDLENKKQVEVTII